MGDLFGQETKCEDIPVPSAGKERDLADYKLRVHTVARRLGISARTVYRLMDEGELDFIKVSERNTRISEKSFLSLQKTYEVRKWRR